MIDKKDITGIVLSGGKSSRMGTDKGFIMYNGKTFTQHSIDVLKPLVSEIIIVSDNTGYDILGYKRVTDIIKGSGPVAGICSGLEASHTNYNLVLSCDIPLIKTEILEKLIVNIDADSDIIQIECNGKTMPLIALYKKQCGIIFNDLLKKDERRLRIAVSQCRVKNIPLDHNEYNVTMNVNTKEELKQLEDARND